VQLPIKRSTSTTLQRLRILYFMTLVSTTTAARIKLNFCIQYKSSITTYDLYPGQ